MLQLCSRQVKRRFLWLMLLKMKEIFFWHRTNSFLTLSTETDKWQSRLYTYSYTMGSNPFLNKLKSKFWILHKYSLKTFSFDIVNIDATSKRLWPHCELGNQRRKRIKLCRRIMGVHKGVLEADVKSRKKGGLQTTFEFLSVVRLSKDKLRVASRSLVSCLLVHLSTWKSSYSHLKSWYQIVIRQSSGSH